MPTFPVHPSDIQKGIFVLGGQEAHHLARVLRVKEGATIKLADSEGNLYEGRVEKIAAQISGVIVRSLAQSMKPYAIHLWLSLLKGEKMEGIVQKAVELNVEGVHFIKTRYSVRDNISDSKWKRFCRIAAEAQKQCGRPLPLKLEKPVEWEEALQSAGTKQMTHLICVERGDAKKMKDLFVEKKLCSPFALWIGPEGGWDDRELEKALARGFYPITLGDLTLRAETAALCAVSMLLAMAF